MFSKCPAHGVWLPVPGKPASGLGRSSQLRTRQGACAGQMATLSQTVTSPGTASPLGLCIWVFTHASRPPRARNGLSPRSHAAGWQPTQICRDSLRAPWLQQADHRGSHRRSKGVGAEAGAQQDDGHPAPRLLRGSGPAPLSLRLQPVCPPEAEGLAWQTCTTWTVSKAH